MTKILVVDDDLSLNEILTRGMERLGHDVLSAFTLAEGLEKARNNRFDVVFLDVQLPDGDGLEVLPEFRRTKSNPEVIIITGHGDPDGAEKAIKSGAWAYIEKPHVIKELKLHLTRALQFREEKFRNDCVPVALKRDKIVGQSTAITHCLDQLACAAVSEVSVLLCGESGTGKEIFAKAIHENSNRSAKNFVVVDCASLPETLIESTLFGHAKGAFTGADRAMDGLVKQADGGTLVLDEVGELPLHIQKSFLRVLQERCFRPVGSQKEKFSDFRLVAATNRQIGEMVNRGEFRQDLLFRLQAFTITLPPLRERIEDIRQLTTHYLCKLCKRYNIETKGFGPEFVDTLASYEWPGNVRELFQTLEQTFVSAVRAPTLYENHLPEMIRIHRARQAVKEKIKTPQAIAPAAGSSLPSFREYRDKSEKEYLISLLSQTGGNVSAASRIADLSRTHLYQLLTKHGLSD